MRPCSKPQALLQRKRPWHEKRDLKAERRNKDIGDLLTRLMLSVNGFEACRDFRKNSLRWNWIDVDDYRALQNALIDLHPWARVYLSTDYRHVLRNPLFHGLASPMRIGRARLDSAIHRLCGDPPRVAHFCLYQPTLYSNFTSKSEVEKFYRAKITIWHDETADCLFVRQHYIIPPEAVASTATAPLSAAHRSTREKRDKPLGESGYYQFTGLLLPRADNLYVVVSVAAESQLPQTYYLNRFPEMRQTPGQDPEEINYMLGWVANIHEKSTYYTAPIAFVRRRESNWTPDLVDRTAFENDRILRSHFAMQLSKSAKSVVYRQVTEET